MIEWLNLTDEQRRITLQQAQQRGIAMSVKALEKDWWVTLTLKALFTSAYAEYLVFKGGTSLSKGWKLINRLSEDIDIALDPEALGIKYIGAPSRSYRDNLRRQGCAFTSTTLKDELNNRLLALGLRSDKFTLEADTVDPAKPDTDPQILRVKYKSLFDPNPYLPDEVKIEVSVRSVLTPSAAREMITLLYEHFPGEAYKETPFIVNTVEPHKTFLEKMFLLHEEFGKEQRSKIASKRMSRHISDLVKNMDGAVGKMALDDRQLYDDLIRHRREYMAISWVKYDTLAHHSLAILPPDEATWEKYREDYAVMQQEMIYGESPAFDDMMDNLRLLQAMVRVSWTGVALNDILSKASEMTGTAIGDSADFEIELQGHRFTVTYVKKDSNWQFETINVL